MESIQEWASVPGSMPWPSGPGQKILIEKQNPDVFGQESRTACIDSLLNLCAFENFITEFICLKCLIWLRLLQPPPYNINTTLRKAYLC